MLCCCTLKKCPISDPILVPIVTRLKYACVCLCVWAVSVAKLCSYIILKLATLFCSNTTRNTITWFYWPTSGCWRRDQEAVNGHPLHHRTYSQFTQVLCVWVCVRGLVPTENKSNTKVTCGVKMPDKNVYRKTYMLWDVLCVLVRVAWVPCVCLSRNFAANRAANCGCESFKIWTFLTFLRLLALSSSELVGLLSRRNSLVDQFIVMAQEVCEAYVVCQLAAAAVATFRYTQKHLSAIKGSTCSYWFANLFRLLKTKPLSLTTLCLGGAYGRSRLFEQRLLLIFEWMYK